MASSSAAEGKKNIILKNSDGKVFEVEEADRGEAVSDDRPYDRAWLRGYKHPAKVVEYMNKHAATSVGEDLNAWDEDYIKNMDCITLVSLTLVRDPTPRYENLSLPGSGASPPT